jgi:membrane protein
VADSAEYSAIYSGFAVVLVFMIWVYLSWIIVLLGGAVAFHCQYPGYLRLRGRNLRLSTVGREQLGILIMVLVGRAQLSGQPAWTLHRLADAAGMPWEVVGDLLTALRNGGLLRVSGPEAEAYVLARDTDCIRLECIVRVLRSDGETPALGPVETDPILKPLLSRIATDAMGLTGERSLREVIRSAGSDAVVSDPRAGAPTAAKG